MFIICHLLGHDLGVFPYPLPEWRILGHHAALIDIYRCHRCGEEGTP